MPFITDPDGQLHVDLAWPICTAQSDRAGAESLHTTTGFYKYGSFTPFGSVLRHDVTAGRIPRTNKVTRHKRKMHKKKNGEVTLAHVSSRFAFLPSHRPDEKTRPHPN